MVAGPYHNNNNYNLCVRKLSGGLRKPEKGVRNLSPLGKKQTGWVAVCYSRESDRNVLDLFQGGTLHISDWAIHSFRTGSLTISVASPITLNS